MLKIPAWTLEQRIAPNKVGFMKKTENIIFILLIICSLSACAQKVHDRKDNSTNLQTLVFKRNKSHYNNIYIEKATFKESTDDLGWIKRVQENLFGFPNFSKEVVQEINSEITSITKDTAVAYNDLFHQITTEKVENFFTREDRKYIEEQIKAAKREKWEQNEYNYTFNYSPTALRISKVYYSKDKNKAVVFLISPTQEKAEFYHRLDGKWKFSFSSLLWIE